ncbi:MAG: putative glycolipid-binding domain-containing protein [Bacteroidota bacterium]
MSDVQKTIWQGKLINTMEFLTLEEKDNRFVAKGNILGVVKEKPIKIIYEVTTDKNWNFCTVVIKQQSEFELDLFLKKDSSNQWFDRNGNHLTHYDGCTDVDISLTPFTNTLPINKLKLAKDESKKLMVLYVDLPAFEIKPFVQCYTNLGNNRYKYENISTGFTSIIQVDDDGFVINYPGIWERIYP